MKFVSALAGAPFLVSAQQHIGRAEYARAMRSLHSLGRVLRCDVPSEEMPIRANIIAFQASYWLDDVGIAKSAASIAVDQSNIASSKKDGSKERYTAAYLYGLCEFAAGKFPDQSDYFLSLAARAAQSRFDYEAKEIPERFYAVMPLGAKKVGGVNDLDGKGPAPKREPPGGR